MARAWAERVGAVVLEWDDQDLGSIGARPVLLEDADRRGADEILFHLINMADAGTSLLITGRAEPSAWASRLPDLRSRLNALMVARLAAPDDLVLRGALVKLFRERNIKPGDDVFDYLIRRIERSIPAARDLVARIDEVSGAEKRNVTRAFVRRILEDDGATLDLFE
jgi:chromosomal replication initiation ATPase DnaA